MSDLISRQDAIDAINKRIQFLKDDPVFRRKHGDIDLYGIKPIIQTLPSAEPKIIRCKCCEYGDQDEAGRWFCRSLDCQIGDEDGSGFCADAERRKDA